jgi:hypothetical protein
MLAVLLVLVVLSHTTNQSSTSSGIAAAAAVRCSIEKGASCCGGCFSFGDARTASIFAIGTKKERNVRRQGPQQHNYHTSRKHPTTPHRVTATFIDAYQKEREKAMMECGADRTALCCEWENAVLAGSVVLFNGCHKLTLGSGSWSN